MNTDLGFILVWRSLFEDPIWTQAPGAWFRVALSLLAKANWKPQKWFNGDDEVRLPAGSLVTSLEDIAVFSRTTKQQVRDALTYLERTKFITRHRTPLGTVLSVTNWARYQGASALREHAQEHGKNTERTRKEHGENTGGTRREHLNNKEEVKKEETTAGIDWFRAAYPPERFDELLAVQMWISVIDTPDEERAVKDGLTAALNSREWTEQEGRFVPLASNFLSKRRYRMKYTPLAAKTIPDTQLPADWRRDD